MMKDKYFVLVSWIVLLLALTSVYFIYLSPDFNLGFLLLLTVLFAGAIITAPKASKSILHISRILLGLLFIYSGFVKGVDPFGTQYRIEDYFYAFDMSWATSYALILSYVLNAVEFSMGVFMLFNFRLKWVSILVTLMMAFFTLTTLNDALYSPVPDCGCFGDALIISNWQTFYKNIVLDILVVFVLFRRKNFVNFMQYQSQHLLMIGTVLFFLGFEWYNVRHLPMIDFRSWKEGAKLIPDNARPASYYFTYKNKITGEEKEYESTKLPWQDSIFQADWSYLSSREVDPDAALYKTFAMVDEGGEDISKNIVQSPGPKFFMVINNLKEIDKESLKVFEGVYQYCQNNNFDFYLLSSALPENWQKVRLELSLSDYPFLSCDDISLKAAIRANPGLIIVEDAKVFRKFNFRDIPENELLLK